VTGVCYEVVSVDRYGQFQQLRLTGTERRSNVKVIQTKETERDEVM
jgi:hypothetical protein